MNIHPLRRLALACCAGLLLAAHGAQAAGEDRLAAARAEFLAAYTAANEGRSPAGDDSAALLAYPLYPYLQAARLRRELAQPSPAADLDARIAALLASSGDALAMRELRRAWLLSLADRGDWAAFLANYSETTADATLRCQALNAKLALNPTPALSQPITELWLSGEKSPAACDGVFAWLRTQPAWTPALIEQRARLQLQAGNSVAARTLAAQLPSERAAPLLQWAALIDNPAKEIDAAIAQPARAIEREALLDGWTRYARKDAEAAAARWDALLSTRRLEANAASPFARALALGLAWSRKPAALEYFAKVAAPDLDALAQEWWARAALWAGDWAQAARVIGAMPESLRGQQRWRYWSLRATAEQTPDTAAEALAQLASEDGWYPALASARLQKAYAPHPQPIAVSETALAQIAALPGVIRARELFLVAMRPQASAEWTQATEALDAAQRTQAIALAARWSWYDQAVATASRQQIFDDYALLYPRPYDAPVRAAAEVTGLREELIYGIVRQESLYRADAVSKAPAYGLMQLIRETAARTAKRLQKPSPSVDALFDPATNITLGAGHLRELVDRFGGAVPVAIAGYNAGPNAAARWLPEEPRALDVWVENIPYNETRTYVQRVLWHSLVFGWQRSGKPQKLEAWLQPISAGAASGGDAQ